MTNNKKDDSVIDDRRTMISGPINEWKKEEQWQREDWKLRDDLPEYLDLCVYPTWTKPYRAMWHTTTCHANDWPRDPKLWNTHIPLFVAKQMWSTATETSFVGYCQFCMIRRVSVHQYMEVKNR